MADLSPVAICVVPSSAEVMKLVSEYIVHAHYATEPFFYVTLYNTMGVLYITVKRVFFICSQIHTGQV